MIRIHRWLIIGCLVACGSTAMAISAMPDHARSLLRERDHLQQQLLRADQQAAEAMLRGEDPVELFAEQTGLQEQVDILQMRLESLAMRLHFDLPPLSMTIEQFDPNAALERHIAVGRQRAITAMGQHCEVACHSIMQDVSFQAFLDF
ncbi:MAG: hypothetical protein MK116_10830 [Phycisphaerales bacterium]|nr:hypothetical protein [Phycisphaerales bacterium]